MALAWRKKNRISHMLDKCHYRAYEKYTTGCRRQCICIIDNSADASVVGLVRTCLSWTTVQRYQHFSQSHGGCESLLIVLRREYGDDLWDLPK